MKKEAYGKKWKMMLGTAAVAAMGMAALTGCSGGSSSSSGSGDGETVELEILLADDTLEGGAMQAVVEKFNEEHADQGVQAFVNEIATPTWRPRSRTVHRQETFRLSARCPISTPTQTMFFRWMTPPWIRTTLTATA